MAVDTDVVRHALLPLPDLPYITCMANLPKPGCRPAPNLAISAKGKTHKKLKTSSKRKAAGRKTG